MPAHVVSAARWTVATLMVTHDQDEALTLSDRIAVMRDGRIEQIGAPGEIYDRPVSRFVASFIGTSNFFRGRVGGQNGGEYMVEAEDGVRLTLDSAPPTSDVLVALRPECIRLQPGTVAAGPNQMATTVEQIVYRDQHTQYLLRRSGKEMLTAIRHDDGVVGNLAPGAAVIASWDGARNRAVRDDA